MLDEFQGIPSSYVDPDGRGLVRHREVNRL